MARLVSRIRSQRCLVVAVLRCEVRRRVLSSDEDTGKEPPHHRILLEEVLPQATGLALPVGAHVEDHDIARAPCASWLLSCAMSPDHRVAVSLDVCCASIRVSTWYAERPRDNRPLSTPACPPAGRACSRTCTRRPPAGSADHRLF